ncbi:MAG TPA: pyridoxamine 5'-phosphate oxidase family protein [Acidimicrobiia bacterium]|nr:pyridoxamine 5'-phosphate oxidase family protein [Acidimicrobiia bacterium]
MAEPNASRPYMPGYGIKGSTDGRGLLPWSWAEERLTESHDYWIATVRSDGRPHLMPVWGVWDGDALWFSSSRGSSKARNLTAEPRCSVATENAWEPVVIEGIAGVVTDHDSLARFIALENEKYGTDYSVDFLDPDVNATYRIQPSWVFSLTEDDFEGSPTRWSFET